MKNKHRLPTHVKPQRYKIMLKPDLEKFTFYGEETIYLSLDKPTKQITLHSAEIEIDSVEWVHNGKEAWAGKISYNPKAETATFTFPKNIQKGKGELKIIFRGILNDKMRGFYRSKYIHDGEDKHIATTQFESTDARRAFPSFDEPSHKAIFDVTLMIPAHLTAISNTIESNVLEHESGYKLVKFAPTPKMSTYLLAFIAGDFEYIEGRTSKSSLRNLSRTPIREQGSNKKDYLMDSRRSLPRATTRGGNDNGVLVRVFTTPGKKDQANFALDVATKCLEFYNNYFDIKYPLPVLDMIAIPDFAAGAMENWGAITYRESTLLIDKERSSTANKQWVALVVAHEIAHMWFGDLVTMKWWTHLWLNEGFASFIEYLAIDHIFPKWDIWTQFVANEMGVAYSLDALENTHPIEVEVGHPAEISEIFDKVSYSKGASILRMLHEYLGAKDFQKGLQYYLKKHAYSNTETEDLWASLEEVAGKPVAKVMKNWTSKAGHPVVTISEHGKSLKLTQSRFFSSPISKKESKDRTVWSIPLSFLRKQESIQIMDPRHSLPRATTRGGDDTRLLMDKRSITIPKPNNADWIKLNKSEVSFFRVDYPHEYLKRLEKAVRGGELSAPDRLGLIRDTFSLAQSGGSPTSLALELALSYVNEQDYTVWSEITGHLSQLDSLLAYESFYPNFKKYGIAVYKGIADKMGWDKNIGEKHTDGLLRGMVLNKLGGFGDKETIEKAFQLFRDSIPFVTLSERRDLTSLRTKGITSELYSSPSVQNDKLDPDLRGVVYNLVAENGKEKEFNTLVKMYKDEENQQEKERIGRSLGKFKNKTLLQKTLEFAISKHVRFQNTLGIIASVWGNPEGRYLAWEFVKGNWKLLKERYAGGHYFTRVFTPAGEFTKKEDAKDIESFVKKNPTPEAKRTIAQALEQIYSNAEWLKRDGEKILNFLEKI